MTQARELAKTGSNRPARAGWLALFALIAVEAVLGLARLASIPADPKNQVLLGYSTSRLALMAVLLLAGAAFVFLAAAAWRGTGFYARFIQPLAARRGWFVASASLALLVTLACWSVLVYLRASGLESHYTRLSPLLYFGVLAGLEVTVALPILRIGLGWKNLRAEKPLLALSAGILAVFVGLWVVVALTGLGIVPDSMAWGIPGVPLLFYQTVFAAAGGGLLLLLAGKKAALLLGEDAGEKKSWRLDLVVGLAIWAAAVLVWMAQPVVLRSYFAPEVRAPNYEVYPFSDAGFYEYTAQSVVIGEGFLNGEIVPRPLFLLGLAVLNAIGGPGYSSLVLLQTLILAAFPVVMYFLGKLLHSRAAGSLAALLAILREVNAIAATPLTTVSNSKLILSDFPTALAIALFSLAVLLWLRDPLRRRWMPLAVGGGMGMLMLIRTQSLMLAPFVLLLALFLYWPRRLRWLEAVLLFGLGAGLVIAPWLARNYQITGKIVFDQLTQTVPLAERYSLDGAPKRLPGENDGEYTARLMTGVRQFIFQHPGQVAKFASAHFLNNEIHTLLALPSLFKLDDPRDTLSVETPFWENWDGSLTFSGGVLLLLNLAFISVGLAVSWRRWRWVGLIPLVIHLGYSASNAAARNSGWRYMLPADWVGYFYYTIGLVQVMIWVLALFGRSTPAIERARSAPETRATRFNWKAAALVAGGLLVVGASLPIAEMIVPQRYPPQSKAEILAEVLPLDVVAQSGLKAAALEKFAGRDDAIVMKGRALYPRFYRAGEGEPTNEWKAYIPREFPRLAFLVLNQTKWNVNLRAEKSPAYFPNAADVVVIGCREATGIDPVLVVVLGERPAAYTRMDTSPMECPLPEVR